MIRLESCESNWSAVSDTSNVSFSSYNSDTSVFISEKTVKEKYIRESSEKSRQTAHQLALSSASEQYPKFKNTVKCSMLHWACHVGWCLCKYQYQPLTSITQLPCTPIPAHQHTERKNYEIEYKPTTLPLHLASRSRIVTSKKEKIKTTKICQKRNLPKQVEIEEIKDANTNFTEDETKIKETNFELPLETTV